MAKPAEQGKHRHQGYGVRGRRRFAFLFLAFAMLPAFAAPQVQVKLSYAGLEFDFAQAMRAWDNDARDDVVVLRPELPLRCRWDADTRLVCRPRNGSDFADATRYRARIAAGLKTQAGGALPALELSFETNRPRLRASINEWRAGMPSILIGSNVATNREEAERALRIDIDGKPARFALAPAPTTRWRAEGLAFDLHLPEMDEGVHRVVVRAVPGLRSSAGPLRGTQKDALLAVLANEPFALRGVSCTGPQGAVSAQPREAQVRIACPARQPIWLELSRKPDPESLSLLERSLPPGVRLRRGEYGRYRPDGKERFVGTPPGFVVLEMDAAGASAEVRLDARLHSTDGEALRPVHIALASGDFQPSLRGVRARALIADGAHPPVLAEAFNVQDARLQARSLGAEARGGDVQARTESGDKPRAVHDNGSERALAEGGWASWTPVAGHDRYSGPDRIEFAAPEFDLHAVAGQREVLAWANAWDGGAPVAGARVELLYWEDAQAQPRTVATAVTGSDGVAMLRLPGDFVVPEDGDGNRHGRWLLRAIDAGGHERSVLPIDAAGYLYSGLGQAPERRMWGVSDRPIYHAGDTVHYRLWQRDRHGTRLMPIASALPVELRLRDGQREKDILAWTVEPAADGSIAGELVLPAHLTDATYCIGSLRHYDVRGACFYVGTYRAQDLWANAGSPAAHVLRDDEPFAIDIEAGYYSGGPAAGMQVEDVQSWLWPLPLQEAYPQYRDYAFIAPEDDDTVDEPLAGLDDIDLRLDAHGRAHLDLKATFDIEPVDRVHLPAFAGLSINAGIKPQDREATTSNAVELRYAHFDRYVGLRVAPAWLDASTPVRLTGIVIDAQGRKLPPADIEVDVDYLPGFADDAKPERIAQCRLHPERESTCDFARKRSGRYRLTARSGDAAPAEVMRYAWIDGDAATGEVDETMLEILGPAGADGQSRRVLLKQPHAHARVLFVMRAGDAILGHLAARVDGTAQSFVLPLGRNGRGEVWLDAIVCDSSVSPGEDGYRAAPDCETIHQQDALAKLEDAPQASAVKVEFDRKDAHPGDTVHILVSNPTRQPREVVLSVMDDALRAQASRWLPYADPLGGDWLGTVWRGIGSLDVAGFDEWNGGAWSWMLPWPRPESASESACTQADPVERGECEERQATAGLAEPPVVFDEPSPMDMQAPPPAPAPSAPGGSSDTLDRVEVTGSRIKRADIEAAEGGAPPKGLRFDRERGASTSSPFAGVRFRFADTALWRPDLRLAPGETRSIEFKLPDNLTRWRAVAWSSDAGDDFAMTDAALDTGLPVEARLQAPVRLYPGDRARIAANVRQVGDTATDARVRFDVAGAPTPLRQEATLSLPSRGEGSVAMQISPTTSGSLLVTADAETAAGRDAVAAQIEIASASIEGRKLQAGWLDGAPLALDLPSLPTSAGDVRLDLSLQLGSSGLVEAWTRDLRDYPHRCWEQILSRAVAAALALQRGDDAWPDARAVVQEALDNAAVFQDDEGGFRYFVEPLGDDGHESEPSIALTAYTLRAFALLRELGHPVDANIVQSADDYLESIAAMRGSPSSATAESALEVGREQLIHGAFAASEAQDVTPAMLDLLWRRWSELPLPAQLAAARAFAVHSHAAAQPALRALVQETSVHGLARTLSMAPGDDAWMGSDLQEQCNLIGLLHDYPALADPGLRTSLVRGLSDLYAGGIEAVDTQTGARCLAALRDFAQSGAEDVGGARFDVGAQSLALHLAAGRAHDEGSIASPSGGKLRIEPELRAGTPASYVAELHYLEDARVARASAMGLSIERRYEVLRDRAWVPVAQATLREGDWIRITLAVDTSAARHFIALTDSVPGGLRPTDLSLSGVGGLDLHKVAAAGSGFFATRRLDARSPRFYAEYLPAGRHEAHYFALVGNSGDYLAAPAVAELMYGKATRARTAAMRLVVADREDGTKP